MVAILSANANALRDRLASQVFSVWRPIRLTPRVTIGYASFMETLLSVRVLRLFEQLGKNSLDLHALFEAAGNDTGERQHVLDAVEELTREEMLEPSGGDFYTLTEKGKEALTKS